MQRTHNVMRSSRATLASHRHSRTRGSGRMGSECTGSVSERVFESTCHFAPDPVLPRDRRPNPQQTYEKMARKSVKKAAWTHNPAKRTLFALVGVRGGRCPSACRLYPTPTRAAPATCKIVVSTSATTKVAKIRLGVVWAGKSAIRRLSALGSSDRDR